MDLKSEIRSIENYPKEGIIFRDITTLLKNKDSFKCAIDKLCELVPKDTDKIVGIEARGFIVGAPVAYKLGIGFVPIRKPGKLPHEKITESYDLEYGTDSIQMHKDALNKGEKVAILDDLLATGGTSLAAIKLIERLGAEVNLLGFLIELTDLNAREKIKGYNVKTVLEF